MRADRDAHRVQNLNQHQHDQQFVQYAQCLGRNRPVTEADPKNFARGRKRDQGGDGEQDCQDGVNDNLGFAQIVIKVVA